MAIENLYYRTTYLSRHKPTNALNSRSPARHITLNTHISLVHNIRKYLCLSKKSVSVSSGISEEQLSLIEQELLPASNQLILFYSKELGVKPKYLEPLLNNHPKFAPEKFLKSAINRYMNLVLSLKKNV